MVRPSRTIRYTLRDTGLLAKLMEHPGTGVPYTVRTLAAASGCSRGKIERLHCGKQASLPMFEAHAVAEALGVAVLVLFMPPVSPNGATSSP